MPAMQTVQIINKSGKIVSTSKHLVNIFKDAKDAYQEKKAEIKAEYRQQVEDKHMRKIVSESRLNRAQAEQRPLDETRERRHARAESDAGERSHGEHRERRRPPLTVDNLSSFTENTSGRDSRHTSRRGSRSRDEPRKHKSSRHGSRPTSRQEAAGSMRHDRATSDQASSPPSDANASASRPLAPRRHTEMERTTCGPQVGAEYNLPRSRSSPHMTDDIDMHLAYGDMPLDMDDEQALALQKELELKGLMSKLDALMLEAQCVQHTAQTIMKGLESNPEAMAAVALTLAEISTLVAKMSPGILTALKASAPAVVALLASPQFLIAGGLAVGVTVVMFGGYKIIKRIQASTRDKEEPIMEEALPYEGNLSSVESWRRGITQGLDEDTLEHSVETSVEGEFITPTADRLRKDKIRARAREEGKSARHTPSSLAGSATTESTLRETRASRQDSRRGASSIISEGSSQTQGTMPPRKAKKDRKDDEKQDKKERRRRAEEDSKWSKENAVKKPNALTIFLRKQVDDFKSDRNSKSGSKNDGNTRNRRLDSDLV